MQGIGRLLEKFRNLVPVDSILKKEIIRIIKNETGIEIPDKHIEYRNNIIYLKTKPIYKTEILLKKEKILETLRKKPPNDKKPQDIR